MACQKLIEQKNFKPLATYYSFAQLIKHRPLCQTDQLCIIEWALKNSGHSIRSALSNYNAMRSSIWKDDICVGNGEYFKAVEPAQEVNLAHFDSSARLRMPFINT